MARSYIRMSVDIAAWSFILWVLYRKIQFYFFPYKQALLRYRRSPQAYALITGASAGIGYGFAQELIAHGFGVILLASRQERLEAAAKKLQSENPDAIVKTIVYNANNVDCKDLTAALRPVIDLPITILVNNVGGARVDGFYRSLAEYSAEDVVNTFNMNSIFMAQLTRIMIPILDRNGRSAIVNVGSGGEIAGPWLVLYGACKAFVTSFSAGIARESKALGWKIDSLGLICGEVHTEGNYYEHAPGTPTSRQYAKIALDRVEMAVDRDMWIISPYWAHALQISLITSLPEKAVQYLLTVFVKRKMETYAKLS